MSENRTKKDSPKVRSEGDRHSLSLLYLLAFNLLIVVVLAIFLWPFGRVPCDYAPWPAGEVSFAVILLLMGHLAWRHLGPLPGDDQTTMLLGVLPLSWVVKLGHKLHPDRRATSDGLLTAICILLSVVAIWIGLSPLSPLQRFRPPLTIEAFLIRDGDNTLVEPRLGERAQIRPDVSILVEPLPKSRDVTCDWHSVRHAGQPAPGCSFWYRAPAEIRNDTLSVLRHSRCRDASAVASMKIEIGETAAPIRRKVVVNSLRNNAAVPCRMMVRGHYTGDLHRQIWVLVYAGGRYYPQDDGGEPAEMSNEEWEGVVRFGNCLRTKIDRGKVFQLVVVTADKTGDGILRSYIAAARKSGRFPGLSRIPAGVTEETRIGVKRI